MVRTQYLTSLHLILLDHLFLNLGSGPRCRCSLRMQTDQSSEKPSTSFNVHLPLRFQDLIWTCLDYDLLKTAVFYAERYYSLNNHDHNASHLYAIALLRCGQVHNAMSLVNLPADTKCSGCSEIKARCCMALGRHRQAREALDESLGTFPNLANSEYYLGGSYSV